GEAVSDVLAPSGIARDERGVAVEKGDQIIAGKAYAAKLFTELIRLHGCHHHPLEPCRSPERARDRHEPARAGAAEKRRPNGGAASRVLLVRAETFDASASRPSVCV